VVQHHCHYTDEEVWDLTTDQLNLRYYFAMKSRNALAEVIGGYVAKAFAG
jgi:hypothetical protein